mmetsp:Transcript_15267/g.35934  ORF Transcript_15267/g.35934 Transcript_15267/m.35934 type:complete len:327 (-) Transcript_15267:602-1582(-)
MPEPYSPRRSGTLCASQNGLSCLELLLRNAGRHDASRGKSTTHDVAHLVHNLRATPLLVGQGLHLVLTLLALDHLHIRGRTSLGILLGEEIDAQGIAVETSQGDELPAKAELGQVPNEGLHLRIGHAGGVPVEGRAQVVGKHLVGHRRADLLGELRGLSQDRLAGLHPNAVGIGGEGDGTLNAELGGALDAVVALYGAGGIPVEVDIQAHTGSRLLHLVHRHLAGILQELGRVLALGLHGLGNGIREGHAAGSLLPVLVGALAHGLVEWLHPLHGDTLDERVIDGVNVGVDHRGRLGICSGNNDQRRIQHIRLQADGNEALDVLLR